MNRYHLLVTVQFVDLLLLFASLVVGTILDKPWIFGGYLFFDVLFISWAAMMFQMDVTKFTGPLSAILEFCERGFKFTRRSS